MGSKLFKGNIFRGFIFQCDYFQIQIFDFISQLLETQFKNVVDLNRHIFIIQFKCQNRIENSRPH